MQNLSSEIIHTYIRLIVTYDGIVWLRNALERLMDDGVIFSTIDEAHFQVSQ
jgi:hypothetical protein